VPNFPFPTPPERGALAAAEAALGALGALEGPARALSARGRAMAALPVTPRHARMLLQARRAFHVERSVVLRACKLGPCHRSGACARAGSDGVERTCLSVELGASMEVGEHAWAGSGGQEHTSSSVKVCGSNAN